MTKTAAILTIGDEILSGRTQDTNMSYIATWLGDKGIDVNEARTVSDVETDIVAAVQALSGRYDYVFTTGGIGPTHDDITAEAIAAAFNTPIDIRDDAYAILDAHYPPGEFTDARKRMARIPDGATLIDNPVSKAPGFRLENVFVMAGVPIIMKAMLESLAHDLIGGPKMESRTYTGHGMAEGKIAEQLSAFADKWPDVSIGSYPYFRQKGAQGGNGVSVVLRSRNGADLDAAARAVERMIKDQGITPNDADHKG
ncbi:MAG: competence/damage-inducible protein A [Alphaproteobacteria bacterium]